jgi:hypothetical protein
VRAHPRLARISASLSLHRERLLLVGSAAGYSLLIAAAWLLIRQNGGMAYDAYAYWLAGRNVLEGVPLYWESAVSPDVLGAYRYPPLFAQLWAPLTVLPPLVFSWVWRIGCLLCLRWLAGSWRNVGLWCLVPFTLTELSIANVTFPMAVMSVMALRGRGWMAAWAGALKVGPLMLMPYLWFARPETRRSLLIGTAGVAVTFGISFLLTPESWFLYVRSLTAFSGSDMAAFGVISLVPNGFADVALRLALGLVLVAIAIRRGSDRLAFTASIVAVPVLAIWRLVPLLVLPRLDPAQRRSAHADADAEAGAEAGADLDTDADTLVGARSPRPGPATIGGHASSTAP